MHEVTTTAELNELMVVATVGEAVTPLIVDLQALSARIDSLTRTHDQIAAALGEIGQRLARLESREVADEKE